MSMPKPTMLHHTDPARRPRDSRSVAVPSPAVDQAIFFLRSHAVTLSAADGVNASSPMAVGRALEAQLAVPEHSLRVTAHHPEHYLVIFSQLKKSMRWLPSGSTEPSSTSPPGMSTTTPRSALYCSMSESSSRASPCTSGL
ncbi:hypothetical protein ZWY2020_007882 [Hordeum vulgare]|nr:hypothetical protein ZWY2020_007882 [Hordeum vulgare]